LEDFRRNPSKLVDSGEKGFLSKHFNFGCRRSFWGTQLIKFWGKSKLEETLLAKQQGI